MEHQLVPSRSVSPRSSTTNNGPPSSALRSLPPRADEDDGFLDVDMDEGFLQFGDGEDWPAHWGAARVGIP